MQTFKYNKTIMIAIAAVILISIYFYYDFQRYQAIEMEIDKLSRDVADLKNTVARSQLGGVIGEEIIKAEADVEMIAGRVKGVEGKIITLTGKTQKLEENRWVASGNETEYKITVNSATKISYKDKEGSLADIKAGGFLFVVGKADPFYKEEVVAERISVIAL